MGRQSKHLPKFFTQEFEEYLRSGRLEHGFLRLRCESYHDEKLLAFSCKRRGFCPSFGARRMADSAALLVDEVLPLRFLFAAQPGVMSKVLGIVYRVISTFLIKRAGFSLHAGVACKAGQGKKRERLCRYITRPVIAERGGRLRIITGKGR
ncbi:MAG: hypothetical protein ACJAVI_005412 [Candidatus Azotimanducaceae bacterium]|jgi:hypothetical protein